MHSPQITPENFIKAQINPPVRLIIANEQIEVQAVRPLPNGPVDANADLVREFLQTDTDKTPGAIIGTVSLWFSFQNWAYQRSYRGLEQAGFADAMAYLGYTLHDIPHVGRIWMGLALKPNARSFLQ